ncbi:hypothetical protein H1C71_027127, partial [Ictidomys tridecemlineatus]
MNKSSFCIQEGSSVHQLLANNLMSLSIKYDVYVKVTGDRVTLQTWPVSHTESALPASLIVQKYCLCIDCTLPRFPPNCSIEQYISLPNGKRLPTGWVFLCNKTTFQALP